jgi:hypothetical protein
LLSNPTGTDSQVMNPDSPIGYAVLAFALAVGGGALGSSLGGSHKRLCALISLGAGTLLESWPCLWAWPTRMSVFQ